DCDRRLTGGGVLHPPPPRCVFAAERKVDAPLVLRRSAGGDRPIALTDLAPLVQAPQRGGRPAGAAGDQAGGGSARRTGGGRRAGRGGGRDNQRRAAQKSSGSFPPLWGPLGPANPAGLSMTSMTPSR